MYELYAFVLNQSRKQRYFGVDATDRQLRHAQNFKTIAEAALKACKAGVSPGSLK